jgi:non-haem dioxygenase in morphine synthesis N-terminal
MSAARSCLIRLFRSQTSVRIRNPSFNAASQRIPSKEASPIRSQSHIPTTGKLAPAQLKSIDYRKLSKREPAELALLLECCQNDGFFYLDLESMLFLIKDFRELLRLSRKWFALPLETKMKNHLGTVLHGYPNSPVPWVCLFLVLLTLEQIYPFGVIYRSSRKHKRWKRSHQGRHTRLLCTG